ncbi:CLUMA_CG021069, isoform A [Clunio marinus]|uniref:CLUMA_CG021069, isoform A n=1 Tax=Clunio marinus TaxID=568069 RepID=A0A1J1J677_9DIPT|nr:CLUMA_CG021069, isoform A [Clunio marinus]
MKQKIKLRILSLNFKDFISAEFTKFQKNRHLNLMNQLTHYEILVVSVNVFNYLNTDSRPNKRFNVKRKFLVCFCCHIFVSLLILQYKKKVQLRMSTFITNDTQISEAIKTVSRENEAK